MMAKVGASAVGAVGALHDRQAEQHRVGEERAEADRHRLAGAAAEEPAGAEDAEGEADDARRRRRRASSRGSKTAPRSRSTSARKSRQGMAKLWVKTIRPSTALEEKTPARVAA